jgi:hypothetical protein
MITPAELLDKLSVDERAGLSKEAVLAVNVAARRRATGAEAWSPWRW